MIQGAALNDVMHNAPVFFHSEGVPTLTFKSSLVPPQTSGTKQNKLDIQIEDYSSCVLLDPPLRDDPPPLEEINIVMEMPERRRNPHMQSNGTVIDDDINTGTDDNKGNDFNDTCADDDTSNHVNDPTTQESHNDPQITQCETFHSTNVIDQKGNQEFHPPCTDIFHCH